MGNRRESANNPQTYMEFIQAHERAWGFEEYKDRPTLAQLLSSPVVIFWQIEEEERLTSSIHDDLSDIENSIAKAIVRGTIYTTKRRMIKIFQNQEQVIIKDVNITFTKLG